jgi:hypothetical protein
MRELIQKADEAVFDWCGMHGQVRAVRHFTCHPELLYRLAVLSESYVLLTGPLHPPHILALQKPRASYICSMSMGSGDKDVF